MTLIVSSFCFFFSLLLPELKCVPIDEARTELAKAEYGHILYYVDTFENGGPFKQFVREKYPKIKFEGIPICQSSLE